MSGGSAAGRGAGRGIGGIGDGGWKLASTHGQSRMSLGVRRLGAKRRLIQPPQALTAFCRKHRNHLKAVGCLA